jgi:hypothetical protein
VCSCLLSKSSVCACHDEWLVGGCIKQMYYQYLYHVRSRCTLFMLEGDSRSHKLPSLLKLHLSSTCLNMFSTLCSLLTAVVQPYITRIAVANQK